MHQSCRGALRNNITEESRDVHNLATRVSDFVTSRMRSLAVHCTPWRRGPRDQLHREQSARRLTPQDC